jgi:rhodanese-related sulfurtransferase
MAELMDCLVNYFSHNADEAGMPRRYYSYFVVGGPGTTAAAGVATITALAVHDGGERGELGQNFHVVQAGGPRAAIVKAVQYLDAYHQGERLWKVQTPVRCHECEPQLPTPEGKEEGPMIGAGGLKTWIDSGHPVTVLDARSAQDWSAGRVKIRGAVRVDPDSYRAEPSWPKHRLTVVYCTCPHDEGSSHWARELRKQGFEEAFALRGGLDAWEAAGGAVEPK